VRANVPVLPRRTKRAALTERRTTTGCWIAIDSFAAGFGCRNVEADREYCADLTAALAYWICEQAVITKTVSALERQYSTDRRLTGESILLKSHDLVGVRSWDQFIIALPNGSLWIKIRVRIVDPHIPQLPIDLSDDRSERT
jgi:hypothetical protein